MAIFLFLAGLAAVLIKHNTVFIVWVLFVHMLGWRRAILWMIALAGLFVLSFVPYLPQGADGVLNNVVLYSALFEYGFAALLPANVARLLFVVGMIALPLYAGENLPANLAIAGLATVALIYGIGQQYYILVLVLAAFYAPRWKWHYIWMSGVLMVAMLFHLWYDYNDSIPPTTAFNLVWLVCVIWLGTWIASNRGWIRKR